MNRRDFIKTTSMLPAAAAVSVLPQFAPSAFAAAAKWRVFEVTTKVEVLKPEGTTRVWLPLPLSVWGAVEPARLAPGAGSRMLQA